MGGTNILIIKIIIKKTIIIKIIIKEVQMDFCKEYLKIQGKL